MPECPPCSSVLGRMSMANLSIVLNTRHLTKSWQTVGFFVPAPSDTVLRALLLLKWSAILHPGFRSFLSKYPAATVGLGGLKVFFQPKRLYDSTKPLFMEFTAICTWSLFPALLKGYWEAGKTEEAICWKSAGEQTPSSLAPLIQSIWLTR